VRAVDLAVYADVLAARASVLAAQLERTRAGVREAAIERRARAALEPATVERLERLGIVSRADERAQRAAAAHLAADLAAVETLQGWVEARLFEAREHEGSELGETRSAA
jgi:hypothetical protein